MPGRVIVIADIQRSHYTSDFIQPDLLIITEKEKEYVNNLSIRDLYQIFANYRESNTRSIFILAHHRIIELEKLLSRFLKIEFSPDCITGILPSYEKLASFLPEVSKLLQYCVSKTGEELAQMSQEEFTETIKLKEDAKQDRWIKFQCSSVLYHYRGEKGYCFQNSNKRYVTFIVINDDDNYAGCIGAWMSEDIPISEAYLEESPYKVLPRRDVISMMGIHASLVEHFTRVRKLNRNELKIAPLLVQAVNDFAFLRNIKVLRVREPLGSMPKILEGMGFNSVCSILSNEAQKEHYRNLKSYEDYPIFYNLNELSDSYRKEYHLGADIDMNRIDYLRHVIEPSCLIPIEEFLLDSWKF